MFFAPLPTLVSAATILCSAVAAQEQTQRLWPAAIPLAVRSPYFSSWMNPTVDTGPPFMWASFWDGTRTLGWANYVRVDGATWLWLGRYGNASTIKEVEITPTRSIFTFQAGPMEVKVTYLSPIEPADLVSQSFPFSYMSFEASSTDGNPHAVEVYSDISGEWASGINSNLIQWNLTTTTASTYHTVLRSTLQPMTETNNIAEDSQVYLGMSSRSGLTWQTGTDTALRDSFSSTGQLANAQDPTFRAINGRDWPVFAISANLGTITSTSSPVVWCIGLVRDPSIVAWNGASSEDRHPYFKTRYQDVSSAIDAFLLNFPNARDRAVALDEKLMGEAEKVSDQYADLISFATRQTLGGLEFTTSRVADGSYDPSDLQIFMKDIGSNGQTSRMNPVEGIYAAFPALLYLNSTWAYSILLPHLKFHNGSQDGTSFVAPDLGSFPVSQSTSHQDLRGVEDTSSMLIMVYAHALYSGNGSLIARYHPLLKRWGDYLVNRTMNPANQLTADGGQAGTSVNLMLKGIVGVQAISGISQALGDSAASQMYSDQAKNFITQWRDQAMNDGHLISDIGDPQSWGLIYNTFADKLIRSNLVGQDIYDSQAAFYKQLAGDSTNLFGLPLRSSGSDARSDWTMLTASTIEDPSTRDAFIAMVHSRANYNGTLGAFPVTYSASSGNVTRGIASPAQGAVYSLLSLQLQPQAIAIPATTPDVPANRPARGLSSGAIAGVVISAVAAAASLIVAFFLWRRIRNRSATSDSEEGGPAMTPFVQVEGYPSIPPLEVAAAAPSNASSKRQQQQQWEQRSQTPSSFVPPVSQEPTSLSAYSSSTNNQLRDVVEDLRREVELMRGHTNYTYTEPPPEY
ncbi:Glutaminase GtaA [Pleurotus pulmonarius]